jgi:3-carboxy-cis,cis-muconate cycloisomerase
MILTSDYFQDIFGTHEMRALFSDQCRFQSWLETEAALAKVQAMLGLIPGAAAERIQEAARIDNIDVVAMRAEYLRVGFPILPLVHQLEAACDEESARWVHWGATTQDIIDTGLVLQMRQGFDLLEADLLAAMDALASLVRAHRDTVMPGRTFQQQAAPITFGFKAAIWLDELQRHHQRLTEVRRRALVCSYGGAVGNLSTLGADGAKVVAALAKELGLVEPPITWHTARDGWAEAVFWLALVGATLGKIGTEVATLMRSEVAEVSEPYQPGRGASSTMPQKRNPITCPILIAAATRLRDAVPSQLTAMIQEHERSVAGQPTEWLVIPEAFVLASGALRQARELLSGLEIDAARMRANLDLGNGLLMAESVMMGLAPKMGRGRAHNLVSAAANRAIEQGTPLRDQLITDADVMQWLSEAELDQLLEPANYLGSTQTMIAAVLANHQTLRDQT